MAERSSPSSQQTAKSTRGILRQVLSANFWKSLIAVVVGNLLYFFVLQAVLPTPARHRPFKLDLGLIVDVWICLFIYGIVELIVRLRRRSSTGL